MTFEAAFRGALLVLGLSTDVPVDRMYARWSPHTLDGKTAAAWSYQRGEGVVAVGVNIDWEEQAGDWLKRFVAAHEACHLKLHMKWIKAPASTISFRQMVLNELEADHCGIWVMGVQAGDEPADLEP